MVRKTYEGAAGVPSDFDRACAIARDILDYSGKLDRGEDTPALNMFEQPNYSYSYFCELLVKSGHVSPPFDHKIKPTKEYQRNLDAALVKNTGANMEGLYEAAQEVHKHFARKAWEGMASEASNPVSLAFIVHLDEALYELGLHKDSEGVPDLLGCTAQEFHSVYDAFNRVEGDRDYDFTFEETPPYH